MASRPETANKEALDKINAQLECSICLEAFKDAKLLPCFHVFCTVCLETMVEKNRGNKSSFSCPKCRRDIKIADKGVAGLQSDFHVDHLFEIRDTLAKANERAKTQCEKCRQAGTIATGFCRDCGKFVCDKCTEVHRMWDDFSDHKIMTLDEVETEAIKLVPSKKVVPYCSKHSDSILKIYCEDCQELICSDCTIKIHHGHNYDVIADTFPKHKEEIKVSLKPICERLSSVNKSLEAFKTTEMEIEEQGKCIEGDINREIDELVQLLGQQRQELVVQIRQIVQQKLKALAAQKDHVELVQVQLNSCLDHVEGSLTTGTEAEVVAMKARVLKQIGQVLSAVKSTAIRPHEMANLQLVFGDRVSIRQACCSVATVGVCDVSPDMCYLDGSKVATEGKKASVTLHVVDSNGRPYRSDIPSLTAELVECQSKAIIRCDVKRQVKEKAKSQYVVTYMPSNRGDHKLHIRIIGKDIGGSPFSIPVLPRPENMGKPVRVINELLEPRGIAKNSKGQILIAEQRSNQIIIFSPDWQKIKSFGCKGIAPGQFTVPVGVAVDNDDNIYVVDNNNHRVQKFNPDGEFIATVGSRGNNPLQFEHPIGIGFNKKNKKLYVCDQSNHRVQVLQTDLAFYKSFGSEGTGDGNFDQCHDLAFDNSGNVYVTDWNNKRFQVFTPDGQFLRQAKFKERGIPLSSPYGIAVDAKDTVYVGDKTCIAVFTSQGKFMRSFGSLGKKEGEFDGAGPLYADQHCVLVSDRYNNRIQVF